MAAACRTVYVSKVVTTCRLIQRKDSAQMAKGMKNPIYTAAQIKHRSEMLGLWDGAAWCDVPCLVIASFRTEGSGHRPLTIENGNLWRANFYKCGHDTSHPHRGAWSPVDELNYHLPRCFGRLGFAA
jgi:hypothetical protein